MRMTAKTRLLALAIATLPMAAQAAPGFKYHITDLGTLGGSDSSAYGLNNQGQIVGQSQTATGHYKAFVWQQGQMSQLSTLADDYSLANDINDSGTIVGYRTFSIDGGYAYRAVKWSGDSVTDLGTLNAEATAINDSGQIAGGYETESGYSHAFIGQNDVLQDIHTLDPLGNDMSVANAINDQGATAGGILHDDGLGSAFLHDGQQMHTLGTLGGTWSQANSVNNAFQVTGSSATQGDAAEHAFLWSAVNGMMDLGTLGGEVSRGLDVDNKGVVVGLSARQGGPYHAFIWSSLYGMQDLNSLVLDLTGWSHLHAASAINDNGMIVGWGVTSKGDRHAFALTPILPSEVPVPAAAWLFGSALLAAATARRKLG